MVGSEVRTPEQVTAAQARADELRAAAYPPSGSQPPLKQCDLVMKGGITSGVVYPLAGCELAKTYRFRSIGGSSAGAIAACLVAAAEYGRDTGGFNRLAQLPPEIGPTLPDLFSPGPKSKTAHTALMTWLDKDRSTGMRIVRILGAALWARRWVLVWGFVLSVLAAVGIITARPIDETRTTARSILAGTVFAAGVLFTIEQALMREVRSTIAGITEQGFGICIGSAGPNADPSGPPRYFTDWLGAKIDEIAGLGLPSAAGAEPRPPGPLLMRDLAAKEVVLQVMTTNLTQGRPMTFPFSDRTILFDPLELAAYFSPDVISALGTDGPAANRGVELRSASGHPLYHLPAAEDTPLIVAARLSLSFPALISAVPLYAVDYARADEEDQVAVRCWFSDGGITSNFPVTSSTPCGRPARRSPSTCAATTRTTPTRTRTTAPGLERHGSRRSTASAGSSARS